MSKKRKYLGVILLISFGLVVILRFAYWFHLEHGYQETQQQSQIQMKEIMTTISASLSRYQSIPHVLSTNPLLADALLHQDDVSTIAPLNNYLQEIQSITEALDIYLVNAKGDTIAASNWDKSYSFIGTNYAFRPYFQQAIKGELGRYYAVGTSSDKRGYYFSYPIYASNYPLDSSKGEQPVLGVIVVKIDITEIEQQGSGISRANNYEFVITDPDNIIFLSSNPQWRLKSLVPMTPSRSRQIQLSRRYANRLIDELTLFPPYNSLSDNRFPIYKINQENGTATGYMDSQMLMQSAGWNVHVLAPMAPIFDSLPPLLLLYGALYLLLTLTLLYTIERRKNTLRLRQAHEQLEFRVKERTQALESSNMQLKETQDELIQAAKLTVIGSLSASINHEINQPLAAIRSYAQNTQTFLARGKLDEVSDNITTIIELTDRLAAIVSQFKSFTRKTHSNDKAVSVAKCIQDTLTIIQPEVDKQGVALILNNADSKAYIWGDSVRLQQVLINLMSNAIVAMQPCEHKELIVSVAQDDRLNITIEDSGVGIEASQMEKIFDPYYTSSRQGLGLGLSISRRIAEAMQGQLTVANRTQGGAIFNISLPIHASGNQ
ncbi:ATP-binding protein [Shewanella sp. Isolate11]|uniref:sensor histidine kinase n=1 Tax=Shewanella sp. Isolate11 TaxID=2908530 RepID=UPI001EFD3504|nr:ATP-binding protein [Shewanella sp. Isolate11]MCG9698321.1 ATP-binding protein [Shewanella sp. Isolate11]